MQHGRQECRPSDGTATLLSPMAVTKRYYGPPRGRHPTASFASVNHHVDMFAGAQGEAGGKCKIHAQCRLRCRHRREPHGGEHGR